jgi:hypothetical protein
VLMMDRRASADEAGVPERPKGPVCKTGGESLRGFESRPLL